MNVTAVEKIDTPEIPAHVHGWLEVNPHQVVQNYKTLSTHLGSAACAAVVKGNGYGLGLELVSRHLYKAGCRQFFVAHLEEALVLRKTLPHAFVYVLSGSAPNTESEYIQHNLIPVINDRFMLNQWSMLCRLHQRKLPILLHFDTGMNRIGLDSEDWKHIRDNLDQLDGFDLHGVMSHLACSPNPEHVQNQKQKRLFDEITKYFPSTLKSLSDTGGIYLGEEYHYDFARPGKGLFGLFHVPYGPELPQAFTLRARVIQVHRAKAGCPVGYGSQTQLSRDSILATLGVGYGDGMDRRMSQGGYVLFGSQKVPIIGSLSMDYTVVDVTDLPMNIEDIGAWADVTSPAYSLEEIAQSVGTISRELSTRLGPRLYRTEVI